MTSTIVLAYLGLGSNLGNRAETLHRAIATIDGHDEISVVEKSEFFETAPWYLEDQPRFINAVVGVETTLQPDTLLAAVQAIEHLYKREREIPNGPRTLDVDILTYGELQLETDSLSLPHPEMIRRPFVLVPFVQIAPHFVVPGTGETTMEHLSRLAFGDEVLRYREEDA